MKNKRAGFKREEFFISGQKSFGLTYSPAGDAEFSQSLSLALKGKLSERVGFSANLSDRNLPSGTGNFSKRLEQFDQIGFGFNFPQGNLSLGDVFFKGNTGRFLNFERKISGLGMAVHTPRESLAVGLGSGPGEFGTAELAGQEGKQGPYYFASGRNFVVPGREKVYLDGELLNSGREADYEVDYERGSLTFTPRRAISGFSRIRVEYEFQNGPYAKNILAAHSAALLAGGTIRLRAGYLTARDRMDAPVLSGLSAEEKERLAAAGSDSSTAVREGAVFVGQGKGSYAAFLDSSGSRQYRYVGQGAGDFAVSFSLARRGSGDYRYLGGGIYEYVGKGRGAYLPVLYLPMPSSDRGTSLGLEFGPRNFLGFVEAAFSEANPNLFSRRPGNKTDGSAVVGGLRWQSSETPAVKVEGRLRKREAGFQYLGRRDENEAAYRWNLLPGEENQTQTQGELSMAVNGGWLQSRFNLGGLALADGRQNGLGESEVSLSPFGWLTLESRTEAGRSNRQSGHYRTKNSATGRWGSFAVTSSVEREKGNPFLGRNLEIRQRWGEKIEYKTYFLETSFGNRAGYPNEESATSGASGWGVVSRFVQMRLGSSPVRVGEKFSTEGMVGWRRTDERGRDFGKGYLFLKSNYLDGGKRLVFLHELSPVEAPSEVYSYADVGAGNGSYRYENGGYVSDPYGNFTLVSEPAGETLAVYRVRQNWEMGWEPYHRFGTTAGFWSQVSCRASFSFDGDFTRPKERTAILPVLGLSESRRHELEFRQTVAYSPETRKSRWELLWQERNSRRSYLSTAAGSASFYAGSGRNERKLDFAVSFYGEKLTQNYALGYLQKNSSLGFWSPFKIRGVGFKSEWLYAFNRTVSFSLGGRLYRDKEQITGKPSLLAGSSPKLILSFPGRGRAEAGVGLTRVFDEPASFEQAEGNLKGANLDYSLNLEYRIGPKLSATGSFLGTQRPRLGASQRASTHLSYLF
ncbi:MAG: hypothetical protein L0196_00320 [candidate division Zixibacteria bacterium]|nr:hypothetical protein [candidate division Zixibacteria bacterium]